MAEVGKEYPEGVVSGRPRLLLVEDDPLIRQVTGRYLGLLGYRVLSAATAAEAIEQIRRSRPAVIVLDNRFPDGTGVELYRRVSGEFGEIPAVLMSAYELSGEGLKEAASAGIKAFLRKPFQFRDLKAVLDKAVRKKSFFIRRRRGFFTCRPWYNVRPGYLARRIFRKVFREGLDPGGHVHFYVEGCSDQLVLLCSRRGMGKVVAKSAKCAKGECIKWEGSEFSGYSQDEVIRELGQRINRVKVDAGEYEMSWPTLADFLCWLELSF